MPLRWNLWIIDDISCMLLFRSYVGICVSRHLVRGMGSWKSGCKLTHPSPLTPVVTSDWQCCLMLSKLSFLCSLASRPLSSWLFIKIRKMHLLSKDMTMKPFVNQIISDIINNRYHLYGNSFVFVFLSGTYMWLK